MMNFISLAFFLCLQVNVQTQLKPTLGFDYGVINKNHLYTILNQHYHYQAKGWGEVFKVNISNGSSTIFKASVLCPEHNHPQSLIWTIYKSTIIAQVERHYYPLHEPVTQWLLDDLPILDWDKFDNVKLYAKKHGTVVGHVDKVQHVSDLAERQFNPLPDNSVRFFSELDKECKSNPKMPIENGISTAEFTYWLSPDGLVSQFYLCDYVLSVAIAVRVSPGLHKPERLKLSPRREIKVDFQEPFMVFANLDSHFFITKSGKVYTWTRLDLCDQWPTELPHITSIPFKVTMIITVPDLMKTFIAGPSLKDSSKMMWQELIDLRDVPVYPLEIKSDTKFAKEVNGLTQFAQILNSRQLLNVPAKAPKQK